MRSKELPIEVKLKILRLKEKKKSIREIADLLGVAKSTVGYILSKKELTGELENSKRPGRPRKTTVVDDHRILSLVEKNPLTTSTEVQNTLSEVGVSVSKSTVKRRLHESKYKAPGHRTRTGRLQDLDSDAAASYNPTPMPPWTHISVNQSSESEEEQEFLQLFSQLAGDDMEVSPTELMGILNKVVAQHPDLKTDGFSMESCRSMVAVMDSDSTGKLGFEEFKYLWNNIKRWQAIYKRYDADRTGTINSNELPGAFQDAGFQLSGELYKMIMRRYSDERGDMDFDNYICCLVRLDAMFRAFKALDKDGDGKIRVTIQEWLQLTMYS